MNNYEVIENENVDTQGEITLENILSLVSGMVDMFLIYNKANKMRENEAPQEEINKLANKISEKSVDNLINEKEILLDNGQSINLFHSTSLKRAKDIILCGELKTSNIKEFERNYTKTFFTDNFIYASCYGNV